MERKKHRYWIPALLVLLVLAFVFSERAGQKLKAKSTLTSALSSVFSQLEERFQDDPILLLAECYNPDGKYSADVEMTTNQELLGAIAYRLNVDVDLNAHHFRADGIARTSNQSIDLSMYLDPDFLAVTSEELSAGEYYGITYDTFCADFRKIPLLNFIVNDTVLARWDDALQRIQSQVRREYPQPQLPQFHEDELRKLLLGVAAMPCQLQKADILVGEQTLSCTELDYVLSGEQVTGILSQLTGEVFEKDCNAHFSFYLSGDALVRFTLSGTTGETPFRYCFDLNQNPLQDPLVLTGNYGTSKSLSVTVATQSTETRYAESWDIHSISQGKEQDHSFAFDWDIPSGALSFRSCQLADPILLTLRKAEHGLQLETQDLFSLLGLLSHEDRISPSAVPAVLTISKGSAIETPDYKNLDQWSMQDFLTLLAGAGSLVGIRLE